LPNGPPHLARWPILAAAAVRSLALLYRYGPKRQSTKFRWVTWGSALAATLWLGPSVLFSYLVANFANYNVTYGSLGAIVIAPQNDRGTA
jgi:membrane protein